LNTAIEERKKDLIPFNLAVEAVARVKHLLAGAVVRDRESRDNAFQITKGADKALKQISDIRLDVIRPLKQDIADLRTKYEKDRAPLDKRISDVNTYGNETLSGDLTGAINKKKAEILTWDQEEQARIDAEQRKIEEEERQVREEQERKEREAQEAENKRLQDIEDEKQRQLDEANKAKGIEAARLKKKAEDEAAAKRKIEEDKIAAEGHNRRVENVMERMDVQDKSDDLNKQKLSGRKKVVWKHQITDITKVPREFLIYREDNVKIKKAIDAGIREIEGIRIYSEDALKYK